MLAPWTAGVEIGGAGSGVETTCRGGKTGGFRGRSSGRKVPGLGELRLSGVWRLGVGTIVKGVVFGPEPRIPGWGSGWWGGGDPRGRGATHGEGWAGTCSRRSNIICNCWAAKLRICT